MQGKLDLKNVYLGTSAGPETERALGFYKKMGFEQIEKLPEGFFDYGENVFVRLEI